MPKITKPYLLLQKAVSGQRATAHLNRVSGNACTTKNHPRHRQSALFRTLSGKIATENPFYPANDPPSQCILPLMPLMPPMTTVGLIVATTIGRQIDVARTGTQGTDDGYFTRGGS